MPNSLYGPVPDEDEEAPAPSGGAYVGIVFGVIFEVVLGVSAFVAYAMYHFLRGWLAGR